MPVQILPQQEVANRLGVDRAYVSGLELGRANLNHRVAGAKIMRRFLSLAAGLMLAQEVDASK